VLVTPIFCVGAFAQERKSKTATTSAQTPAGQGARKADAPSAAPPAAEEPEPPPKPAFERKVYTGQSGTTRYSRLEEIERKTTADGEVEIERVRAPSYAGDRRVLQEREIRTRKLPDGTIEKEYILKNPDGSNRLVPIEIIRERIRTEGDTTRVEREVQKPDLSGRWQTTRRERVEESGPEEARERRREVEQPDVAGGWKVTERETTTERVEEGAKQVRSVRQVPDARGRLADYEVREERSTRLSDRDVNEVTVKRRDLQGTEGRIFQLVERTVTESHGTAEGKTVSRSVTESDLVAGGASRNLSSSRPVVVEERVEEETTRPDGTSERTVEVKARGAASSELRPSHRVVQSVDREGRVREIFIPAD
jgi:hypothetical protein